MVKAQLILLRAAIEKFEAAIQKGDFLRARRQAADIESMGRTLRIEMELAPPAPPRENAPHG